MLFLTSSCEKDNFVPNEFAAEETITLRSEQADLPTTIRELRQAGVRVPARLARIFNNDLAALLRAAEQSTTRRGRRALRRQGLNTRDIRNLQRIFREFQALVDSVAPGGDNGDNPADEDPTGLTPISKAELADIADAQGLQLQQEAIDNGAFTPRELLLRQFGSNIRFNDFWNQRLRRAARGDQATINLILRLREDFANANGFTLTDNQTV